jgi:hypothetical protein
MFRYRRPKGTNRIKEIRDALARLGAKSPVEVNYDYGARFPGNIEEIIDGEFASRIANVEEIVIDISAMSKLLILISLCKLCGFGGRLRIVCSEAEDYAPTKDQYDLARCDMSVIAQYPSQGVESIIRTKCLSSIRMQGQPVTLVAFTSFNEQLVRQMLGTLSPHRLLFINGTPPRDDYSWRERATQQIHERIIEEYSSDNPKNKDTGLLSRSTSTLDYTETFDCLNRIYVDFGLYERIICAATGSKMQTVGLFFFKMSHPDIHVEYPTPNSYFVKGMSVGVRKIYEVIFPNFANSVAVLRNNEA